MMKVSDFSGLFAIDPRFHMYMTEYGEEDQLYRKSLPLVDGFYEVQYPTFMRTYLYIYHLLTGVDYLSIYQYFGFITRIFLAIILLAIFRKFAGYLTGVNHFSGALFLCLLFSHYYFWFRAWITFPENFVLIFHSLVILVGIIRLQNRYFDSRYYFSLLMMGSFSLWYHNSSFLVPAFFIFTIMIFGRKKFGWHKDMIRPLLFSLTMSVPVLGGLVQEYIRQFVENVGTTGGYKYGGNISRFFAPTFSDYINFSSFFIISGALYYTMVMVLKSIYRKISSTDLLIFICFSFVFLLSNTTRLGLNLPKDRMQSFLMIILVVTCGLGFTMLLRAQSKILKFLFFVSVFLFSLSVTREVKSWLRRTDKQRDVGNYLNLHFDPSKYYYFTGFSFVDLGFYSYKNVILKENSLRAGDLIISSHVLPLKKIEVINDIYIYAR